MFFKQRYFYVQVIPHTRGSAWEQPPPDLASCSKIELFTWECLFFLPSELILAEFLYLQYEDEETCLPIHQLHGHNQGMSSNLYLLSVLVMLGEKQPCFWLLVQGETALLYPHQQS